MQVQPISNLSEFGVFAPVYYANAEARSEALGACSSPRRELYEDVAHLFNTATDAARSALSSKDRNTRRIVYDMIKTPHRSREHAIFILEGLVLDRISYATSNNVLRDPVHFICRKGMTSEKVQLILQAHEGWAETWSDHVTDWGTRLVASKVIEASAVVPGSDLEKPRARISSVIRSICGASVVNSAQAKLSATENNILFSALGLNALMLRRKERVYREEKYHLKWPYHANNIQEAREWCVENKETWPFGDEWVEDTPLCQLIATELGEAAPKNLLNMDDPKFILPLLIAFGISPMCLLSRRQYAASSSSRVGLGNVLEGMSCPRPSHDPTRSSIEHAMLNMILDVASEGYHVLRPAMVELIKKYAAVTPLPPDMSLPGTQEPATIKVVGARNLVIARKVQRAIHQETYRTPRSRIQVVDLTKEDQKLVLPSTDVKGGNLMLEAESAEGSGVATELVDSSSNVGTGEDDGDKAARDDGQILSFAVLNAEDNDAGSRDDATNHGDVEMSGDATDHGGAEMPGGATDRVDSGASGDADAVAAMEVPDCAGAGQSNFSSPLSTPPDTFGGDGSGIGDNEGFEMSETAVDDDASIDGVAEPVSKEKEKLPTEEVAVEVGPAVEDNDDMDIDNPPEVPEAPRIATESGKSAYTDDGDREREITPPQAETNEGSPIRKSARQAEKLKNLSRSEANVDPPDGTPNDKSRSRRRDSQTSDTAVGSEGPSRKKPKTTTSQKNHEASEDTDEGEASDDTDEGEASDGIDEGEAEGGVPESDEEESETEQIERVSDSRPLSRKERNWVRELPRRIDKNKNVLRMEGFINALVHKDDEGKIRLNAPGARVCGEIPPYLKIRVPYATSYNNDVDLRYWESASDVGILERYLVTFSKDEWDAMDKQSQRAVLAKKNVHIRNGRPESVGGVRGWNATDLDAVLDLHERHVVLDQGFVEPELKKCYERKNVDKAIRDYSGPRFRFALSDLSHLLDRVHDKNQPADACLNFLEIPVNEDLIQLPCDDFSKYLSHVYAPDEVRVLKTVVNNEHLYRRWAIAATIGAWSDWHCDAAGYGTFLHMWAGSKIWVLSAMSSRLSLQDLDNFIGHQSVKCMPLLLLPGDQLYMLPGQEHQVYTTMDSIAFGAHFYNYDTIPWSLDSIAVDHYNHPGYLTTNAEHHRAPIVFIQWAMSIRDSLMVKITPKALAAERKKKITDKLFVKRDSFVTLLVMVCNLDKIAAFPSSEEPWITTDDFKNDFQLGVEAVADIIRELGDLLPSRTLASTEDRVASMLRKRCPKGEKVIAPRCICLDSRHKDHAFVKDVTEDRLVLNTRQWPAWMSQI